MAFWLADKRTIQDSDVIQRFDPRFWTVDFPRPMMASVITLGSDALRVDATFYHGNALAGLIWDSVDRWSHPLLCYERKSDYRRCSLSFRWRSEGINPLDAINGPTLTIEGRDSAGNARAWYVRLWNYATGTPEDAQIVLPFGGLDGGFLLPSEADPVFAGDIDRMFISLVPPGYDGTDSVFAEAADGWVELTDIRCTGGETSLVIGDIMLPEHRLQMATGYDDAYNQTPERLLRQIRALGYRGSITHYVGMSHYFRLQATGADLFVDQSGGALNAPCRRWHRDFTERAGVMGFLPIFSLSYELFDAHCPPDWKQRAENGDPALTGWSPPSTLLSPANGMAMAYLQAVGSAFATILKDAGCAVRFQIGEPWWWIMPDGRPCLYDAAVIAAFGGMPVSIPDMRMPMSDGQKALLDQAGALLAASTATLAQAVRQAVAPAAAEVLLLVYLPTVLDPQMPEARRANLPQGWTLPAFDVLQLEDYDWATAGRHALTRQARAMVAGLLGYPVDRQHYLAGFVLNPADRAQWNRIERAAIEALEDGVAECFIWALPQVLRDGFTHFELERQGERDMQSYRDTGFPLAIGRHAIVMPEFSTGIVTTLSGHERRNSDWSDARMRYDVGPGVRSEADMAMLMQFFRACRGAAIAFPFRDPLDHSSAQMAGPPGPFDQRIGMGDGISTRFQLVKSYGEAWPEGQRRPITRPVAASVRIGVGGVETTGWTLLPGGWIELAAPAPQGEVVTAGFLFDVPVRFAADRLEIAAFTYGAGEAESILLVEAKDIP